MLPLKGASKLESSPSGQTQSTGRPPARVTWARVVSKKVLAITVWPGRSTITGNSTFSAARPWWTGWMYS